ncbi:hypothetical protein [Sedimentibacter sp.]|uniref:hypothetical protein n=1 Tax=Sedimentibacter sp. TaxID=1960295 RepID=UPI0028B1EE67|nr:hypothetical protein [Sedimentibacter sp.]
MTHQINEKKRAYNIIWNASEDYSFEPEYKIFDEEGKADIYSNYIIGAVRKYYDYSKLQEFFKHLRIDSDHEFYEELFWLGLENSTFEKGKIERPALINLRKNYAQRVLSIEVPNIEDAILREIKKAHYQKVIGEIPKTEYRLLRILDELEFDAYMNTDEIISKMKEILKKYFRFNYGQYEKSFKKYEESKNEAKNILNHYEKITEKSDDGNPLMKDMEIESAETTRYVYFEQDEDKKDIKIQLYSLNNRKVDTDRRYIEKYYGSSTLPEHKIMAFEKALCVGNHKNNHLHFTRGEYDSAVVDADTEYIKRVASEKREANINFYYDNYARNLQSIVNLTNKIRNTMMMNFEQSVLRSKEGKLVPNKIWRNIYVNDNNIFSRDLKNDLGNISVDILLDASASQNERQEIIASQAFIIAESLTRCQIPVKVYSFSSLRTYTVINLLRDYEENDKNDKIFNYRTSGCNRDGLAVRTALHMMEDNQSEHKILIVLSDCKPNDIETNPGTGIIPTYIEYSGVKGVSDTAMEVKKGTFKGNTVLCVFTGDDEDLSSAKKIYGHNFVRINSLNRFADMVGLLLQNQLKNI